MIDSIFADSGGWNQGICIGLCIYNFINYIYIKDRSFLYYAMYLFTLTIFLIPSVDNNISQFINSKYGYILEKIRWLNEIAYLLIYIIFSSSFFNFRERNKKVYRLLKSYIKISFIVSIIFFFIDFYFFNAKYFHLYNLFVFLPSSIFIAIPMCREIYKLHNILSWLYLIGLSLFVFFTLSAMYFMYFPRFDFMVEYGIVRSHFLFTGIFFEVIFLSVMLGYKNIVYKRNREISNELLIKELQKKQAFIEKENYQIEQLINKQKEKIKRAVEKTEKHKLLEAESNFQNQVDELKLSSLLNQMNPHFLFNALNSIKLFIIDNDAKKANYYLNKFSKLIRQILNASKQKQVSLYKELETLKLYFNIENIRFNNEINYELIIEDNLDTENIYIPSLALQPFLENAIWHGLSAKKGEKNIVISLQKRNEKYYEIQIKDNGIGRSASSELKKKRTLKRKSVGIKITKERFNNFTKKYKNTFSLTYIDLFKDDKPAGTIACLKIPLE